ncbi:MAG: HEAT repeat domain-containing protein [Thermodesulfobacteriota bacterium]
MRRDLLPLLLAGLAGLCLAGPDVSLLWVSGGAEAAVRTLPRRSPSGSPAVTDALAAPTEAGRVQALLAVMGGDDLPAALEAMEMLASMGPPVVPRLVSEMRHTRNNWLVGGALVAMGSQAVGPMIELLDNATEATVVDCLYLLGEIQDRRAVPTLVRYLDDRRDKVRMHAVTALLQIGGPRAVEAVLSRLTREGKGLESFIVESLLRYGRKSVEPVLQSLLSDDPRVRREAAYLLGGLGDLRAVDPLLRTLGDPDPRVRRNAAYALGELGTAVSEPQGIVIALSLRLADESPEVADSARAALVRYGPRAVETLIERARTGGEDEKLACLNALREIGSPEGEAVMIELLRHPQRRIRIAAAAGLITSGTGRAVEALLDALRDDDLRWFATLALEKVGGENPDLFFSARPNDPTMSLRTQILVRLGPAVIPALREHLRDESVGRRAAALWILGEIGDPSAAPDVLGHLIDPHLGWLAGRALHKLGQPGLEALVRYTQAPPSEPGAHQAVEALALFDDARAWDALEAAVGGGLPRAARVRSAVLVSLSGDPARVDRLRAYLDGPGQGLWPDVEAALRAEGQVR